MNFLGLILLVVVGSAFGVKSEEAKGNISTLTIGQEGPLAKGSRQAKLFLPLFVPAGGNNNPFKTKPTKRPTFAPFTLQPEDRVALDLHNAYRITHGNVPSLTYSENLKGLAQMCADYHAMQGTPATPATHVPTPCPLIPANGGQLGESGFRFTQPVAPAPTVSASQRMRMAITMWYDELANPVLSPPAPTPIDWMNPAYSDAYRHGAQIIWKATAQLGCANSRTASTAGVFFVYCVYSPPGNVRATFADNVLQDTL